MGGEGGIVRTRVKNGREGRGKTRVEKWEGRGVGGNQSGEVGGKGGGERNRSEEVEGKRNLKGTE